MVTLSYRFVQTYNSITGKTKTFIENMSNSHA